MAVLGKYNRKCERELGEYIPPLFPVYKRRNVITSVPIHVPSQTNSNKGENLLKPLSTCSDIASTLKSSGKTVINGQLKTLP